MSCLFSLMPKTKAKLNKLHMLLFTSFSMGPWQAAKLPYFSANWPSSVDGCTVWLSMRSAKWKRLSLDVRLWWPSGSDAFVQNPAQRIAAFFAVAISTIHSFRKRPASTNGLVFGKFIATTGGSGWASTTAFPSRKMLSTLPTSLEFPAQFRSASLDVDLTWKTPMQHLTKSLSKPPSCSRHDLGGTAQLCQSLAFALAVAKRALYSPGALWNSGKPPMPRCCFKNSTRPRCISSAETCSPEGPPGPLPRLPRPRRRLLRRNCGASSKVSSEVSWPMAMKLEVPSFERPVCSKSMKSMEASPPSEAMSSKSRSSSKRAAFTKRQVQSNRRKNIL
mmetsp:Transcript_63027/g.100045  ORF Transcript_63027/g.100045 Transcript_63027/m.100045 type:complete len:334 (+) Transcript_63027:774-1775(+)